MRRRRRGRLLGGRFGRQSGGRFGGLGGRQPGRPGERRARRGAVVLPALVAGGLATLSLPPWGWWPLGAAGAALLWWRLDGLGPRARLLAGWVFGLGLFVPGLWWATNFNVYGGVVLMLAEALAPALAAACSPGRVGRTLALPGAMVLAEQLRDSWPFGGLPIGSLALGQAAGPLADTARLGGPLLVLGVTWLVGCGIGALVVAARWSAGPGRRPQQPAAAAAAGATAVLAAVALAVGAALVPSGGPDRTAVQVAAVQGGGRRGVDQAEVPAATVFDAALAATAELRPGSTGDPPRLVLWPEDVVSLPGPLAGSPAEALLAATARHLRAVLVVGVTEDVGATRFRNEAVAFSPGGRIVGTYEKVHRVPFGEYVPDRAFFSHLANLSEVPRDAIPGDSDGVLDTPVGRLGTMVSYEVFYADRGRIPTDHGADLLIVPTNTSSYRTSQVPTQEVAADRLQAVAEGRWLVQAAPTGFSDVVTPDGGVVRRSALGHRQVLVATVHLRDGLTPYARGGDAPVLGAAGACLAGGWAWALWRRRRRPVVLGPPR